LEAKGRCKVWFGDESGFTENPPPANAWAPAGNPHAHEMHTGTRKRLNAIGCCDFNLNPVSVCFKEGKVGGVDFRAWGQALAAKCDRACPSHLWLDNGPIHKAKATLALLPAWKAKGLIIHFLPAYSPELNRIEIMWRIMKRSRPFELLEIAALRAALKSIVRHLRRAKSYGALT
jgi:transposase